MRPVPATRELAVLTRLPVAGRAKTRLIPALGADGAAELQRKMTAHTLRQARMLTAADSVKTVVWFEGGSVAGMRQTFGSGLRYVSQPAGDLGERIRHAVISALARGAERVVVVGCDCPDLDAVALRSALDALDSAPVVLGPAADGGYYLIGARAGITDSGLDAAFADIPWGTPSVLEATVRALGAAGIRPALLPVLCDIDEPDDLPVWERASQPPRSVSVVIPALEEESTIGACVVSAMSSGVEVIVVDGGSTDRTREVAAAAGARVVTGVRGRARQLNAGAATASGDALLFLHADTTLPRGFAATVLDTLADPNVTLGAFAFATDLRTPTMRLFERGTNWRARRLGMPYGDQALFMRMSTFRALGAFPDLPLMEDYELALRARRSGLVRVVDDAVVTSARAWREGGVWRSMLVNRLSVLAYRLGVAPDAIARWRRSVRRRV